MHHVRIAVLLASLLCGTLAAANDYYWTVASPATGYYDDSANWVDASGNPGTVPTIYDKAFFKRDGLVKIEANGFGNSPWEAGELHLGSNLIEGPYPPGPGAMSITGGDFVSNLAYIGDSGATGSLAVSGTGTFTANNSSYVGTSGGTGHVTLANDAVFTCGDACYIAVGSEEASPGGQAELAMSGASRIAVTGPYWCGVGVYGLTQATWTMSNTSSYSCGGSLFVGDSGGETDLTMSGDTSISTDVDGWMGTRGGTATLDLSGTSSLTALSRWCFGVDPGGYADITMSGTASISSPYAYLGYGRDAEGNIGDVKLTMLGGNVHADNALYFADAGGAATVTMSGTSSIDTTAMLCFGTAGLSEANVEMSEHATLSVDSDFYLGWVGSGTLTMSGDTSVIVGGYSYIGDLGGTATVTMTGNELGTPTISVTGASRLGTGNGTTATLSMTDAYYFGTGGWMGGYGVDNEVGIDLHGQSIMSFTAWLNIGAEGSLATVDLHDDSAMTANNYDLGWGVGANAQITLHDDSSLTATGTAGVQVCVGIQGGNAAITLTGSDSPSVTTPLLVVGQQWLLAGAPGAYPSRGTMTVGAAGAQVTTDALQIGYLGGIGVYHQNAGVTTVATPVVVGDADDRVEGEVVIQVPGSGTLNLNGGVLACPGITAGRTIDSNPAATLSTINLNGGTLRATATNADFIANPEAATLTVKVQANGAVIDTNGFNVGLGVALTEDAASTGGGLTKRGAGTLTLTAAAQAYAGDTRVEAGTLATTSNATLADDASLWIAADAVMKLDFSGVAADAIGGLYLGGVAMTTEGTWGSTASGAAHQNDAYFAGLGMVLLDLLSPAIPGDTNGDGFVNAADAQTLAANWGQPVDDGDVSRGDFNSDGWVNAADASILAANWTGGGESSTTVPEPTAIVFLWAALAMLVIRRR